MTGAVTNSEHPVRARTTPLVGTRTLDALALAALLTVSWTKLYWEPFGKLQLSDIIAALFVVSWVADRVSLGRTARRMDKRVMTAAGFVAASAAVAVIGFAFIQTGPGQTQFMKGLAAYLLHAGFLLTFAQHLCDRGGRFARRAINWLIAGFTVNALWGLTQLGAWVTLGVDVDATLLGMLPFSGTGVGGIKNYGGGVYRINGLMRDTNHLGVSLVVPLLLGLGALRGRRRALVTAVVGAALILSLSRSGLLGALGGLTTYALLATERIAWRKVLLWAASALAASMLAVQALAALNPALARSLIFSRLDISSGSTQTHLGLYELLPTIIANNPLFGIGLNGFSLRFEEISGRVGFGPHSHFVRLIAETGVVGAAVWAGFAWFVVSTATRRGNAMSAGIVGALVGTWVGNLFYLTTHMLYVDMVAALALAAPATGIVYNRSAMATEAHPRDEQSSRSTGSQQRSRNRGRGRGRNQSPPPPSKLEIVASRWWVVLLTVIVCALPALISSGTATTTYQGTATVYLGQPVAPNGALLNTVSAKAATAFEVVQGDAAVTAAAKDADVSARALRSGLSVTAVTPPIASKLQTPPSLVRIRVTLDDRKAAETAAGSLAATLIAESNEFADAKVKRLETRVDELSANVKELSAQRAAALAQAGAGSGADRALWIAIATSFGTEARSAKAELAEAEAQLEVAAELERSKLISAPRASKVTVQAGGSKLALGVLAGLVLGSLLAYALGRRASRR